MCILLFGCTDMCVYAVRFYACARVPASVVHRVRLLETCNERKEDIGRRVSREVLRTSRDENRHARYARACPLLSGIHGSASVNVRVGAAKPRLQ
jgi:hypothetical protein